ncbi:MAG TPA: hypothetical protein VFG83_08550 [Kofleriaceae bacterium]|nr:hypothetical protein [Kofleriaceae bacterium]
MERAVFDHNVRQFITENCAGSPAGDIRGDENLFNAGLLQSFKLPKLIRFLGEQRGEPVDLTTVTMESFYTIDRMYHDFIAG